MDARQSIRFIRVPGCPTAFLHFSVCAVLLVINGSYRSCNGQNVYKDYVTDEFAQYSPCDHQQRGLVYRIQTGHAGFFGQCDDDRQKMVSPYIDWHCRTADRRLGLRFVGDMFQDIFRKSEGFRDGAGACVLGNCPVCQQHAGDCHCQTGSYAGHSAASTPRSTLAAMGRDRRVALTTGSVTGQPRFDAERGSNSVAFSARNQLSTEPSPASPGSRRDWTSNLVNRQLKRDEAGLAAGEIGQSASPQSQTSRAYFAESGRLPSGGVVSASRSEMDADNRYGNRIDPGSSHSDRLVPEDQFQNIEKQINVRTTESRRDSTFRLSSGGVYKRPDFRKGPESGATPEPVAGQKSDPRYFQFQQIGGSKYR